MVESEFRKTHETFVPGSMTLPQEYYKDDEIFRKEKEKIFSKDWTCAGHVSKIPNPGDYFVLNQGDASVIVLKDRGGSVRSLHNVCRHRGTQICDGEGKFANSIQCSYHAWTYDLSGKLIGAPFMNEVPGFKKEDYPLKPAAVNIWEGFIFVNLDLENSTSFDQKYPELTGILKQWNMETLTSHKRISYEVKSNWKYIFQNFNECYHCPTLHPQLDELADSRSGHNDLTEGEALGGIWSLKTTPKA